MIRYLLDTDVICKRSRTNGGNIRRWIESVDDNELAISVITIFEISKGIQKKRDAGDSATADGLQASLDQLKAGFHGRIFPVDPSVAEAWGSCAGSELKQWMDRALIATARTKGLILVTCNSADLRGHGVEVINPDRKKFGHWASDGTEL